MSLCVFVSVCDSLSLSFSLSFYQRTALLRRRRARVCVIIIVVVDVEMLFFSFFRAGEFEKLGEEDTKEKGYLFSGRSVSMLATTNVDRVLDELYKKRFLNRAV